ncbi:MAG: hypothetical protein IPO70_13185 [Bacteroidetes bacterium]|nr:hypothetical protein [Bacteroidota bacterium]
MKLSFVIQKESDIVFDYLTDMQKFASVHPIISSIDPLSNENYLVHETLKIGFITFAFTYPVTLIKDEQSKIVIIKATVFKLTRIEMKFSLVADKDFTRIEEEILFKTILPIKNIMKRIFTKQHQLLFKNIEMTNNNHFA